MTFSKIFLIQKNPIRNKNINKKCKNMEKELILNETSPSSRIRTRIARIFTDPCASPSSAQSVFHRIPSAFICVYLRLIFVSLSDRIQKAIIRRFVYLNSNQNSNQLAEIYFKNYLHNEIKLQEFVSVRISFLFNAFITPSPKRNTPII